MASLSYTEQRRYHRRYINMSLAFFLKKNGKMASYFFGRTRDVSPHGACVYTQSNYVPTIDSQVVLRVTPGMQSRVPNSSVSIHIKGQVVWNNSHDQSFGVRFL